MSWLEPYQRASRSARVSSGWWGGVSTVMNGFFFPSNVEGVGDDRPPGWGEDACVVCPARSGFGPGEFDVVDGLAAEFRLDQEIGWRVDRRTRTAVSVHPYRVELVPGRSVSDAKPLPDSSAERPAPSVAALVMPDDVTDLEGWLVAVLRVAPPDALFDAIGEAERAAHERFAPGAVTEALRRVLSYQLAHRDRPTSRPGRSRWRLDLAQIAGDVSVLDVREYGWVARMRCEASSTSFSARWSTRCTL